MSDLKKQEKSSEFDYPYEYVPKCAAKGKFFKYYSVDCDINDDLNLNILISLLYRYVHLWQKGIESISKRQYS